MMKGLLVRVGADQSAGGGHWNGPVNSRSREFVYVAIPESSRSHEGLNKPYADVCGVLGAFGHPLPTFPEWRKQFRCLHAVIE